MRERKKRGEVVIDVVDGYDGDNPLEVELYGTEEIKRAFREEGGLGWVNIYLVATPDGKIIEKHVPSY